MHSFSQADLEFLKEGEPLMNTFVHHSVQKEEGVQSSKW